MDYSFERLGQLLHVVLPYLEFSHVESDFNQKLNILNKQILDIVESNFDNVGEIVEKYLDTEKLQGALKGNVLEQKEIKENREEE